MAISTSSIRISDFLDNEYSKAAAYDTLRSLANVVDGLKISERKAIWVALKTEFGRIKVSQFASKVSEQTSYIHGEGSMQSVISNIGRDFTGSNNMNLFIPDGNFGSRFIKEPSAPRYIFLIKSEVLKYLFPTDDLDIYEEQIFEGDKIEPKYLVPTLPLLLINGAEGIGTGYKQNILPRNLKEVIEVIKDYLADNKEKYIGKRLVPWYRGFNGKIRLTEDGASWEILGHIYYKNSTTLVIDEIPIGYTLTSYIKVLDDLKESTKGPAAYIKSYTDLSEQDHFLFEVKVNREFGEINEEELLNIFKLIKREAEIFTCMGTNNKVLDASDGFINEFSVIEEFLTVKLEFEQKRKDYLLAKIKDELKVLKNKYLFILAINEGKIDIKLASSDVAKILEDNGFEKVNNSYSYLLDMKISAMNKDKLELHKANMKKLSDRYKALSAQTPKDMLLDDLKYFEKR